MVDGNEVTIRPVCEDDGENGLFDVLSQLTEAPYIPREEFCKLLRQQEEQGARLTIVAEMNGRIVGTGSVMIEPKFIRGGKPAAHIEDIVVDKGARGLKLGKQLIEKLTEYSEQRGCYKVILDCNDDNVPFYKKCGFNVKERQMTKYL